MEIKRRESVYPGGSAMGYVMWISADDTRLWATLRPGMNSHFRFRSLTVHVNSTEFFFTVKVDGDHMTLRDDQMAELKAMVGRYLPVDLNHLWPFFIEEL